MFFCLFIAHCSRGQSLNGIGDAGAAALAAAVKGHATLARLDLSGNGIGEAGAGALAEALLRGPPAALTRLDLGNNQLGDVGAHAVAEVSRTRRLFLLRLFVDYSL